MNDLEKYIRSQYERSKDDEEEKEDFLDELDVELVKERKKL